MLDEAGSLFLNGDPAMARVVLRDLVNATVGFEGLASAIDRPSESLHRMLSATGNPGMDNPAATFDVLCWNLQVHDQCDAPAGLLEGFLE
ncbi:DNA-binding protein [Rhodanobacter ginsenosidimutans]|uniref:DNA-binding protein n=1 Tax=Rhodanobacter ginsenosidimutans TaxID=490571 RepID=A0ABW0JXA4_9GAMM